MKSFQLYLKIAAILFLVSCHAKQELCEEERELEIVPGESIGEYQLGMNEDELQEILCSEYDRQSEKNLIGDKETVYYFIKNMSFIFRKNRLREINVWGSFKGSFEEIDVNYDRELLELHGDLIEYKGDYRLLNQPGISFGKPNSDDGRVIKIFRY